MNNDLLIISCSKTKKSLVGLSPAISLYDGPAYKVLSNNLSGDAKPTIWILSAKHGLIHSDSNIYYYDESITSSKKEGLRTQVESFIHSNSNIRSFSNIFIWMGKQYLDLLPSRLFEQTNVYIAGGPIGKKLHILKSWCLNWQESQREVDDDAHPITNDAIKKVHYPYTTLNYLIPDWDDYLDPEYDYYNDKFSWNNSERKRLYAHELFKGHPIYDGILISLGHIFKGKGLTRNSLKGGLFSARKYLHLDSKHILMGDCGAFSYRRHILPPFTSEQVIKLYNSFKVDIGASIDHIPFGEIIDDNGQIRTLTKNEIENRVELTAKLGREFIELTKGTAEFIPMGVIQGLSNEDYAQISDEYVKAGYQSIALGGLVPKSDDDILQVTEGVIKILRNKYPLSFKSLKIHIFGVLREKIFPQLAKLGVTSFDSASYLRKAWLRSDKNYLSQSGTWFSAIRVPFSNDSRFQENALREGISVCKLEELERNCLNLLREYDMNQKNIVGVLNAVTQYDSLLLRSSDKDDLRVKYQKTLENMPWKYCNCPVCSTLGIETLIFRGYNRNKRRGFHNTWVFYNKLREYAHQTT